MIICCVYCKCCYYFYYECYNNNKNISIHGSSLLPMLPREDDRASKSRIHPSALLGRKVEGTTHLIRFIMNPALCFTKQIPSHVIFHVILINFGKYEGQTFYRRFPNEDN